MSHKIALEGRDSFRDLKNIDCSSFDVSLTFLALLSDFSTSFTIPAKEDSLFSFVSGSVKFILSKGINVTSLIESGSQAHGLEVLEKFRL